MSEGLCLEVLIATVVAWAGVWGIVEEAVDVVESRALRCCLYAALLVGALALAAAQRSVTVCGLV